MGRNGQCQMLGSGVTRTTRSSGIHSLDSGAGGTPDAGFWDEVESEADGGVVTGGVLLKAQSLGFGFVALPWGDSEKYDFIVWARPQGRVIASAG